MPKRRVRALESGQLPGTVLRLPLAAYYIPARGPVSEQGVQLHGPPDCNWPQCGDYQEGVCVGGGQFVQLRSLSCDNCALGTREVGT